jgi:hypothetical protein
MNIRLGTPTPSLDILEKRKLEVEEGIQRVRGYQAGRSRRSCIHSYSGLSIEIIMIMGVRLNCITLWSAADGKQMNMEHWLNAD